MMQVNTGDKNEKQDVLPRTRATLGNYVDLEVTPTSSSLPPEMRARP